MGRDTDLGDVPSAWGRAIAVCAVLAAPVGAHAETPLVATAGIGLGVGSLRSGELQDTQKRPGIGAIVDVAYRVHPIAAVGVHLAMGYFSPYKAFGSVAFPNDHVSYVPIQLAVSAQVTLADRVWFAPLAGVEDGQLGNENHTSYRALALGLSAGIDITRCHGHRWGALITVSRSHEPASGSSQTFIAALAGIGYRYW